MESFAFKPSQVAGKDLSSGDLDNINEEFLVSAIAAYLMNRGDDWAQWIDLKDFSEALPNLNLGPYNDLLHSVREGQSGLVARQMLQWGRSGLIKSIYHPQPKFIMTVELLSYYHQFAA